MESSQEAEEHASLKKQTGLLKRPEARSVFEQIPMPESVRQAIDEEAKEITDMLERQLGSNASEKVIPKLQREDAIISGEHAKIGHIFCWKTKCEAHKEQKHAYLS